MIGPEDIEKAAGRLSGVAHVTPVLTSKTLDELTGASVFLKAENFQRGGSFKFRGAYNGIATLDRAEMATGVIAYSSGNHAQAVALSAAMLGTRAVILMPEDAPDEKIQATRAYGAEVIPFDRYRDDRVELAATLGAQRGLTLVPPYDDPRVMAGQGTVGLELLEVVKELDYLLVPVGGGGLIAGCGTIARAGGRIPRVIGIEPSAGDDTKRSLEAGSRVRLSGVPRSIADGLQVDVPGELTFEVNRRVVDEVTVVSDPEIVGAMRWLFDRMKLVVEPSGAVAVAAILSGRLDLAGGRVGAVLSGGNVGAARFAAIVSPGGPLSHGLDRVERV